MKKTILTTAVVAALAISSYGQATILVNNLSNTGVANGAGGTPFDGTTTSPVFSSLVTSNGLFFTLDTTEQAGNNGYVSGSTLMGADFSWALYGGSSAGNVTTLIASMTGSQIVGDNENWGQLQGPGAAQSVNGTVGSALLYLDLYVWEGNTFSTYALAQAGNDYTGTSGVFTNPSGSANPPAQPFSLIGMPDVLFVPTPEPGTMALAGLGSLSLLLFRRKK